MYKSEKSEFALKTLYFLNCGTITTKIRLLNTTPTRHVVHRPWMCNGHAYDNKCHNISGAMNDSINLEVPVLKLVTEIFTLVAEINILYKCYESMTLGAESVTLSTESVTKITTHLSFDGVTFTMYNCIILSYNTVRSRVSVHYFELHSSHTTTNKEQVTFPYGTICFQEVRSQICFK